MSYSDFLDTLISPIRLFISALSQVADTLIHNYIFITLLGLSLFISLLWLIYYTFHNFIYYKINKTEYKINKYNNYKLDVPLHNDIVNKHDDEVRELKHVKNVLDSYYKYYDRKYGSGMSKEDFFDSSFGFRDLDDVHLDYKEQIKKYDLPVSSYSEYLKDYYGVDLKKIDNDISSDLEDV